MIFSYSTFIQELRHNPEKRDLIDMYERHVGPLGQRSIQNQFIGNVEQFGTGEVWYTELVRPFAPFAEYSVPAELIDDFDWGLLSQLGAASLSSRISFRWVDNHIHMLVTVQNGPTDVERDISTLWGFQVLRLFEIWIEENISLCTLCHENTSELEGICAAKIKSLEEWNSELERTKFLEVG
mgnify:CR=1 FL=1